jgi:hypothetical protein
MLSEFMNDTLHDRFVWGQNDCALWCASAVLHMTGYDPAEDLRGSYSSRFECRQKVLSAGGMVSLIAPRMVHSLLTNLSGDGVAVVRVEGVSACAIIMDGRANMRTETGVRISDEFSILRGWSWLQ